MFCAGFFGKVPLGRRVVRMVQREGFEDVLGLGPPDPAFIARGSELQPLRSVLNDSLKARLGGGDR